MNILEIEKIEIVAKNSTLDVFKIKINNQYAILSEEYIIKLINNNGIIFFVKDNETNEEVLIDIFNINNKQHIRTHKNNIITDNLENLPIIKEKYEKIDDDGLFVVVK